MQRYKSCWKYSIHFCLEHLLGGGRPQPSTLTPLSRLPPASSMAPLSRLPPASSMGPLSRLPPASSMTPLSRLPPASSMTPLSRLPPASTMAPLSRLPPAQQPQQQQQLYSTSGHQIRHGQTMHQVPYLRRGVALISCKRVCLLRININLLIELTQPLLQLHAAGDISVSAHQLNFRKPLIKPDFWPMRASGEPVCHKIFSKPSVSRYIDLYKMHKMHNWICGNNTQPAFHC